MRHLLAAVLLVAPAGVWAGGAVVGTTGRTGVSQSGLNLNFNRQSGTSRVTGSFQTGSRSFQSSGGALVPGAGGYPGFYRSSAIGVPGGYSGVYRSSAIGVPGGCSGFYSPFGSGYAYRGWVPYSPYLLGGFYGGSNGVGPFEFVDAMVFNNPPAAPVFGVQPPVRSSPPAPEARAPAVGGAPAGGQEAAARRLVDVGDRFFGRGEFARAAEAYRAAARNAPDDPMAAFALGHGLFATGAYAQAAAELRRALGLYPAMVQVAMNRRAFYGDPMRFDEQLGRLAAYVEANPGDADARFLLGYNYFFSGRRAEAKAEFAALGAQDAIAQLFLQELGRGQ